MESCKMKALNTSLKAKSDPISQKKNQNQNQNAINSSPRKPRLSSSLPKVGPEHQNKNASRTRSPSPNASRATARQSKSTALSLPKRAQSAERRPSDTSAEPRPAGRRGPAESLWPSSPCTPASDTSAEPRPAGRRGPVEALWPSMRNLSSSFQLEPSPVGKKKGADSTGPSSSDGLERKRAPLTQSENSNSKVIDQHRWPAMRGGTVSSINMSKSVDLSDKIKGFGSGSGSTFVRSRGISPKRSPQGENSLSNRLAVSQLSPNSMSKSVDLTDKSKGPGASRGASPRRTVSSESTDFKDKIKRPASPVRTGISNPVFDGTKRTVPVRGASPIRTAQTSTESTSIRTAQNSTESVLKRGVSPIRTAQNSTESAIKRGISPVRTAQISTESAIKRGISPIRTPQNSTESALKQGICPVKTAPNPTESTSNDPPKRPPSSRGLPISHRFPSTSLSKSIDLGPKSTRPVSSSFRRNSTTDMSKSVDLDRFKRPTSSSGRSVESNPTRSKSGPDPTRSQSLTRSSRTVSSPITGFGSKRVVQSPLRGRPSTPCSSTSSSSSSGGSSRGGFASSSFNSNFNSGSSCGMSDVRVKGKKKGFKSQIEEMHELKLLSNRDLQWKFVNACVDDVHSSQKLISEGMLYGMWSDLSLLRNSVAMKRLEVQQLRQETKLEIVLNEQIEYLDSWAVEEREHCGLLSEAIEGLKASTLRLPVTGGAKADVLTVRNAVSSAIDIMQAMGSSIFLLLPKVENANSLVEELALISAKERAMLDQGRELVATVAKLQVQESSLKTQLIQLRQDCLKMDRIEETEPHTE